MSACFERMGTLAVETSESPKGVVSWAPEVHRCNTCFGLVIDADKLGHLEWHDRQVERAS